MSLYRDETAHIYVRRILSPPADSVHRSCFIARLPVAAISSNEIEPMIEVKRGYTQRHNFTPSGISNTFTIVVAFAYKQRVKKLVITRDYLLRYLSKNVHSFLE